MLKRLLFLFLAGSLTAGAAAAEISLVRKYVPETSATTHVQALTKQVLTLAGMDLETDVSQFIVATAKVGKREADGTLPIENIIEKMQSNMSLPGGNKIEFDSDTPDKKADNVLLQPLVDILRVSAKTRSITRLDKDNQVAAVVFVDNPSEQVSDEFKSLFDGEKRKKSVARELGTLPDKPVKPGDSWTRTSESDLGAGQTLTLETRYEYVGTQERDGKTLDYITLKVTDVSYTMEAKPNAVVSVKDSQLKIASSEGSLLFDRERGVTVVSESKVAIAGTLTLVAGGMELPGKLDLKIESKTTLQP
jgi:Family of unknown function (DUF6263)